MTMKTTTPEAVVLRDRAGVWYLLTPAVLAAARVPAAQQEELEWQLGDGADGFSVIRQECRDRFPIHVAGEVPVPNSPAAPDRTSLTPCL